MSWAGVRGTQAAGAKRHRNDMNAAAVEVRDLQKFYRNGLFRQPSRALQTVSLRVERGEIFGLLGPNGAGKTTLIKVLLGIVRPSGGTAELLGRPAGNRQSRLRVGYLPENLRIAGHHTAQTALEYYGCLSGLTVRQVKSRRSELLESVGLAERAREPIRKYSKGMLQRLGLAQALIHDPELLILDEPTDGLDPVGRSHVRTLLNRLQTQGKTVFLNSHLLQEVELVCNRVAVLDRGIVRAQGGVEELAVAQSEGVELDLTVLGSQAQVRAALGDRGVKAWEVADVHQHSLRLRLNDQAAVDAVIDDLRRQEVSIVGIHRKRLTLEDAFLSLFAESAE